jgi:hypothetical protein
MPQIAIRAAIAVAAVTTRVSFRSPTRLDNDTAGDLNPLLVDPVEIVSQQRGDDRTHVV